MIRTTVRKPLTIADRTSRGIPSATSPTRLAAASAGTSAWSTSRW
jgi:hypothetical protein